MTPPAALLATRYVAPLREGGSLAALVEAEDDGLFVLGRAEPDAEVHDLLAASVGVNLGMDYLPRALAFHPAASDVPGPEDAADVVWLDALATNVDRTARNPNLLVWHGWVFLIDHGACLYRHHADPRLGGDPAHPFPAIAEHVLLPRAGSVAEADARLAPLLDRTALEEVAGQVPDAWLDDAEGLDPAERRRH